MAGTDATLASGVMLPAGDIRGAALVLPGSSNRLETARARLLVAHGIAALPLRLFDEGLELVPLERYVAALDVLTGLSPRLGVVGTSKGAEAALLLACRDPRITGVVAFAPSSVAWAGLYGRQVSSWSWRGRPVPFVRYDERWRPDQDPPAYRGMYEASLLAAPDDAHIPVESIRGQVLLVAGGDDQVWPSLPMAETVQSRRGGDRTTLLTHAEGGHRTLLPGEATPADGQRMARGGLAVADAELGARAWPDVLRVLVGGGTPTPV